MTKIRTGNTTSGRPGGWGRGTSGRMTGGLVNKTKASAAGVRRLFARDPSNGLVANIGTKRDVNPSTGVNMTAAPNPRVVKAPQVGKNATDTHKNVVNRGSNRRVRRTNS
jgi:hypothetical protein